MARTVPRLISLCRGTGDFAEIRRIQPNVMIAAMMVQQAAVTPQVAFEVDP
jgi:hypothetical protein